MNQTVLITGACINTGVDIVKLFAQKGWNIVFTGRTQRNVCAMQREYEQEFPNACIYGYTLNSLIDERTVNEEGVEKMFENLDEQGVTVNAVVLNAANQGFGIKIFENPLTDFMKVINTNICWNYCIIEKASCRMKKNGGGSIVFVNSNTAYRAIPDRIAYEASKGGQLGMMRGLALDLGKYNIRVNAVLPGMIITNRWAEKPEWYENVPSRFTPLGEVATGHDVAEAVYFLTAHAKNSTGTELTVDGGNMIQLYPIIKN